MPGIYEQLKEKFIMENAWDDWRDYRKKLTDLVNSYAGDSLLVVGAGSLNDIDIESLIFQKITLLDVNGEAMRAGIERLPEHVIRHIQTREVSITGIMESDISRFCEDVLAYVQMKGASLSAEAFNECLNDGLDKLEQICLGSENILESLFPDSMYDVILCNGVCSQLFSLISFFIRSITHSVADALFPEAIVIGERAEQRLKRMNDHVIPIIDQAIVRGARKSAIFGNEYPEEGYVEGAYQSIGFIRENYKPIEKNILWNFNPYMNIQYNMLIQIIKR